MLIEEEPSSLSRGLFFILKIKETEMYNPNKGYWINVDKDSLTTEEKAKVREYLNFFDSIASGKHVYFYFQESAGVLHTGVNNMTCNQLDVFTGPKEFMYLLKLYSINKELALTACVETVKRKLEEEFGGLG